jgi:hypothetical protein
VKIFKDNRVFTVMASWGASSFDRAGLVRVLLDTERNDIDYSGVLRTLDAGVEVEIGDAEVAIADANGKRIRIGSLVKVNGQSGRVFNLGVTNVKVATRDEDSSLTYHIKSGRDIELESSNDEDVPAEVRIESSEEEEDYSEYYSEKSGKKRESRRLIRSLIRK